MVTVPQLGLPIQGSVTPVKAQQAIVTHDIRVILAGHLIVAILLSLSSSHQVGGRPSGLEGPADVVRMRESWGPNIRCSPAWGDRREKDVQ